MIKKLLLFLILPVFISLFIPLAYFIPTPFAPQIMASMGALSFLLLLINFLLLSHASNREKKEVESEEEEVNKAREIEEAEERSQLSSSLLTRAQGYALEKEPCLAPSVHAFAHIAQISFPPLFNNIVNYLNATSDPMSESLVDIKTAIASFLESVKSQKSAYDEANATDSVKSGILKLRTHISEMTQMSAKSCDLVSIEVGSLEKDMNTILGIVANIADVAERIHILSINASIEAARAGVHGRGFKIIADEVQRLSLETSSFVTTIGNSVKGTQKAFNSLHTYMGENKKMVAAYVKEDSEVYEGIATGLNSELSSLNALYEAVLAFIATLEVNIDAFNPLAMLHSIITQEVENMERACADLLALSLSTPSTIPEENLEYQKEREAAVARLRGHLTTARELDALADALKTAGLGALAGMHRSTEEIEFF